MCKNITYLTIVLSIIVCTGNLSAQIPQQFLPLPQTSVATTDDAFSAVVNPAGLGVKTGTSFYILSPYLEKGDFGDWGYAFGGTGFAYVGEFLRQNVPNNMNRHSIGFGGGDDGLYFGSSYSWSKGLDRQNQWDIGMLARPYNYLSFGAVVRGTNSPRIGTQRMKPGVDVGIALRPLALMGPIGYRPGHRLTLTADAYMRQFDEVVGVQEEQGLFENIGLKMGASAEFLPGIAGHIDFMPEIADGPLKRDSQLWGGLSFKIDKHSEVGFHQQEGHGIGSSWIGFSDLSYPTILKKKKPYYVEIRLAGPVVEFQSSVGFFTPRYRTIFEFNKQIRRYANDPEVEGILLKIDWVDAGWAKLQEMRDALREFKVTGKKIVVYMESGGNGEYYLATAADKIYIPPASDLGLTGLSAQMMFLRGTLDKIGVNPELEHIGDFKSASDMMTRRDISEAQKIATDAILDDFYASMVEAIAKSRGKSEDDVRKIIDSGSFTANEAYNAGLVDSLIYSDQINEVMKAMVGGDEDVVVVSEKKLAHEHEAKLDWEDSRTKSIAVVYGVGAITSGESSSGGLFSEESMGSETIVRALREAREDDDVAAIVFRVDSPGGSGLASEMISREVARTTEGDDAKPFIVSMSDVAGSGGYYIACKADTILAMPGTITGSIGVISGKFSFAGLHDKIDLGTATLKRGEHADMYSSSRSFTDEERTKLRNQIQQFYDIFVAHVADGRDLDTSAVNAIGQGRIWSGKTAVDTGLVDMNGGLNMALEIAAQLGGIKEGESFNIEKYPHPRGADFVSEGMETMIRSAIPDEVEQLATKIAAETRWRDGEILMLMPYELEIK